MSSRCARGEIRHAAVLIAALQIVAIFVAGSTHAEISELTWDEPVVLATGVDAVSSGAGTSLTYFQDRWRVVFEKDDQVFIATQEQEGWTTPTPLTSPPAVASDPHISGDASDWLYLVWEDSRSGHPEVWTRRFDGTTWTDEECLTEDDTPSAEPVVANTYSYAAVAWTEGAPGAEQVHAKLFQNGVWGATTIVSSTEGAAGQPSVTHAPLIMYEPLYFAWTDHRHGSTEIYGRLWHDQAGWQPEERITDLEGACSRPSVHGEYCCGDVGENLVHILFEQEESPGVPEVWFARNESFSPPRRISAADGTPSMRPNVGGLFYVNSFLGWGGADPKSFITWTDVPQGGPRTQQLAKVRWSGSDAQYETLSASCAEFGAVAAFDGDYQEPSRPAPVLASWIEVIDDTPSLIVRSGGTVGCERIEMLAPHALLLSPAGTPSNIFQLMDVCRETPYPRSVWMRITFPPAVDQELTWAPFQTHPIINTDTDSQGRKELFILGGGCSQAGQIRLQVNGITTWVWSGAKSPDVDGDCAVRDNDVEYVQAHLGTDDFCADLDGTFWVDEADLAIVQATLGNRCSNVVGVDDADPRPSAPLLRVTPNPIESAAVIRFDLLIPAPVHVRILNAGGRLLREWVVDGIGGSNYLSWDARAGDGERLAAGWYVVSATCGAITRSSSVIVTP